MLVIFVTIRSDSGRYIRLFSRSKRKSRNERLPSRKRSLACKEPASNLFFSGPRKKDSSRHNRALVMTILDENVRSNPSYRTCRMLHLTAAHSGGEVQSQFMPNTGPTCRFKRIGPTRGDTQCRKIRNQPD